MDVDGSKMVGHLEKLEQAVKSKIYARMWVVQMEMEIMPPRMRTQSAGRPAIESLGWGTGEPIGRGGRGRRPKEGNDEHVYDLNGQANDQGQFPCVLAVMHWLVQLAFYNEHVVNYTNVISDDSMLSYSLTSYLHYIAGDDDAVDRDDAAFTHKIQLMEEKEKQLAVKVKERIMICAENEELKKTVEGQVL
nr:hypothetical protein [Tanacetum cinerariifolium]